MISPRDLGLPAKFTSFRTYPGFSQWETAARLASSDKRFQGICAPPGVGKCHAAGTEILMFDGSIKKVENIRSGEFLMGPDSQPRRVLDTHYGFGPLLEIVPVKGDSWKVNERHILTLVRSADKGQAGGEVLDISISEWKQASNWEKHHLKLFRVGVDFVSSPDETDELFFDPYILGVFLGDGSISHNSWVVCKPDPEILESMQAFANKRGLGISVNKEGDQINLRAKVRGEFNRGVRSSVRSALEELSLFPCSCEDKFVPYQYKFASRENRLEILAGILDTDGHLASNGFDYISKSKTLADDVTFLCRSLSLAAYMKECIKTCQNNFSGTYYRVSISGDCSIIPTRIKRKKASPRLQKKNVLRTGFSIRESGNGFWIGFSVDRDHRYLLADFTVTHNSVINFTASRLIDAPRTLYLTPKKSLQTQLMNDFADSEINLFSLTGHSSYPCTSKLYSPHGDLEDMECSEGRSGNCPYWQDVDTSLSKSNIVSNPANWVSIARAGDPDRFGKFDLLILDEAHNLEGLLCDLLSIKISKRSIGELLGVRVPTDNLIPSWIEWAKESLPLASSALAESRQVDKLSNSRESTTTKRLKRLLENLSTISTITDTWVCEPIDSGSDVKLTPVFASNYAEKYLFRGIERIILSSATLTREDFTYLGIDIPSFDLIDIESGFAVNRRPFYYWPTCPIQHDMVDGQWAQVMNRIDKFIDLRSDRKGIIQSISYPYAERIASTSRHSILTHKSRNAQAEIERFMSDPEPSVLASPIIYEGFDFKDRTARYNIILKVPTPPNTPLIEARKRRDKNYKLYLAAKTILQMYGRPVRSMSDWAEAGLMLDTNWGKWMYKAVSWPKYFRRAWVTVRDVPKPINF